MRILMVTPYAPHRDGIAAYAVQSVAALRREGHDVDVLSPGPSAAHHHLDLAGPRGALALARRVRDYDKVIVQWHPDVFFRVPASPTQLANGHLALRAAFSAAREVEVRVHEIDYRWGRGAGPLPLAARLLWRAVDRVVVHTEVERERFAAAFGVPKGRIVLAEHGSDFERRTSLDRPAARERLGLPADAFVFLTIGFIQPHKGFDRAVRAFAALHAPDAQLHVVGSVRVEDAGVLDYVRELERLVADTPGAHLHEGFVSDELFDRWLVASDLVVLPYRSIWSSGVMERAALYDRPVVATRVGGLEHQAALHGRVRLVDDDEELRTALADAVGATPAVPSAPAGPWPAAGPDLRGRVQREVVGRAAARRPHRSNAPAGAAAGSRRGRPAAAGQSAASAAVRRLPPLQLPAPVSARPGVTFVKRLIRRLVGWEVDPVVWQVNALRDAVIDALETTPAQTAAAEHHEGLQSGSSAADSRRSG